MNSTPLSRSRKRKLLVADDSITIQKLVNLTLAGTEFEVITAFDGFDAKNKIKRLKPELILLDAKLREINGLKLCAEIRKDKQLKSVQIILMRSNPTAEEREAMAKVGPDAYLDKPFDSRALWAMIQNLTGLSEERTDPAARVDSEDDTKKVLIPAAPAAASGPFSSYREAEKTLPKDPQSRLASIAAEIDRDRHEAKGQPVSGGEEALQAEEPSVELPPVHLRLEEAAQDSREVEVTGRIRFDELAREEIRAWIDKNLPALAEKQLKQEITKLLLKP